GLAPRQRRTVRRASTCAWEISSQNSKLVSRPRLSRFLTAVDRGILTSQSLTFPLRRLYNGTKLLRLRLLHAPLPRHQRRDCQPSRQAAFARRGRQGDVGYAGGQAERVAAAGQSLHRGAQGSWMADRAAGRADARGVLVGAGNPEGCLPAIEKA